MNAQTSEPALTTGAAILNRFGQVFIVLNPLYPLRAVPEITLTYEDHELTVRDKVRVLATVQNVRHDVVHAMAEHQRGGRIAANLISLPINGPAGTFPVHLDPKTLQKIELERPTTAAAG